MVDKRISGGTSGSAWTSRAGPRPAPRRGGYRPPPPVNRRLRVFSSILFLGFALAFLAWPYWSQASAQPEAPVVATPPAVVIAPPATSTSVPTATSTATAPATTVALASSTATPAPTPSPTPRALPAVPVRLRIPAIGVDAPIIGVGLLRDGEMEAPSRADQVGWFKLGVRPGAVGNALLDGHLDWLSSVAVFYRLGKLEPGDPITVLDANGAAWRFRVEWKELVPADKPPMERIVGQTTVPALTLITCGGKFNRATQDFSHRWVVRAVEAPAQP
ncbi:MAG: class F sortase [Chloroflexota bacterium]